MKVIIAIIKQIRRVLISYPPVGAGRKILKMLDRVGAERTEVSYIVTHLLQSNISMSSESLI